MYTLQAHIRTQQKGHYPLDLLLSNCLCTVCADFCRCFLISTHHQQGDEVGLGSPSATSTLGPHLIPPGLCPADELLNLCHQQIHIHELQRKFGLNHHHVDGSYLTNLVGL